jgi:Fe-S-cluster containining protein
MKTPEDDRKPSTEDLLEKDSKIRFQCGPGLTCFTTCCRDVNIFLSPYDILRMKNRLKIPSEEFLEKYTKTLIPPSGGIPVIQLMMREDDNRCPFVAEEGCTIYSDRPWSCRMYPLDWRGDRGGYFFLVDEDRCVGRKEEKEWDLPEWLHDQGVEPYEEMDLKFQTLTRYPRLAEAGIADPRVQYMFRMACYDLDTFRRFVMGTRFLKVFDVAEEIASRIETDDEALLDLAFRWIRFGLVCGDALPIREELMKGKGKKGPETPTDLGKGGKKKAKGTASRSKER